MKYEIFTFASFSECDEIRNVKLGMILLFPISSFRFPILKKQFTQGYKLAFYPDT
jgi:hypothetical protein